MHYFTTDYTTAEVFSRGMRYLIQLGVNKTTLIDYQPLDACVLQGSGAQNMQNCVSSTQLRSPEPQKQKETR